MTSHNPSSSARAAANNARANAAHADWRSTLARWGLAAKGVLYAALGVLAINVASGDAASETVSKRGAIELVASQPFGQWLLGILTAGLFALAIWQIILAFKGDPVEGSEAKDRAKFAGKGLIYLGTASTALSILIANWGGNAGGSGPIPVGTSGGAGGGGGASEQQATAMVMSWPGGPWIVGLIGAAVIGAAIYQLYKHAYKEEFMQRLDRMRMSRTVETGTERAGRAGYAARAIVFTIIGIFFIVAAVQHDPQEAMGLSGALKTLAEQSWGQAVLWAVAIGLFLFGCFSFAEAKYRRAT